MRSHAITAGDVLEATGASHRQLYYWTAAGYVHALNDRAGTGHRLVYSTDEVRVIAVLVLLVREGIQLQTAVRAARVLAEANSAELGPFTIGWRERPEDTPA